MKTLPLNNNVLVEVLRDDDGVSRTDENETMKFGRLIKASVSNLHLTASAFGSIDKETQKDIATNLSKHIGCIVRWEEYAEGGQTFEEDGKTYALIPWWRLISVEETN